MKKFMIYTNVVLGSLAVLALWHFYGQSARLHQLVAVSWGDGKHGAAFYGVYIYAVPVDDEISVRSNLFIGRGTPLVSYQHEIGEVGRVATMAEAVKKWGVITWKDDGVAFGSTQKERFFLKRETLENHR